MPLLDPEGRPLFFAKKDLLRRSWRRRLRPEYLRACEFFGAALIDRTSTLDIGVEYSVIDPLSAMDFHQRNFQEICEDRAKEIAERFPHKSIRVLWSGGIDSTAALVALIKEFLRQGSLERLKVLLSVDSIQEFPSFFEKEIEGRLEYRMTNGRVIFDCLDSGEVNITGEHGDQLFGSDKLRYAVETGEAFRPYEEVLWYLIARKLGKSKAAQSIIDYLSPQVEKSPIPIHTLYDYLWWMNFSLKWQNVSLRLLNGLQGEGFSLGNNLIHFFSSGDFQSWSISNHHQKIGEVWSSYKQIAKDYIHAFHPNEEYRLYKEKEPSLKGVLVKRGH